MGADNDLRVLKGTVRGPPDSPYVNGTFEAEMIIPDNYPFVPPKVSFLSSDNSLIYSALSGQVHHARLASQRELTDRRHLPRHPRQELVSPLRS